MTATLTPPERHDENPEPTKITLGQIWRQHDDPAFSDGHVALLVVEHLRMLDNGLDIAEPAIKEFGRNLRRHVVARAEQRAVSIPTYTPGDDDEPYVSPVQKLALEQLEEMVGHHVMIPDEGKLLAEDITREQWQKRSVFLGGRIHEDMAARSRVDAISFTLKAMRCNTIAAALRKRKP